MKNEEKRRHCNANWKPTRENNAKLQFFDLIMTSSLMQSSQLQSYDVIMGTRSSTNLYLYYFIIKCNLFMKILQCSKNTTNMKFVQKYKFPKKIFQMLPTNSYCWTSESCRILKISQNMSNRYKLKVTKSQPIPVYIFWNFSRNLSVGEVGGVVLPPRSGSRVRR